MLFLAVLFITAAVLTRHVLEAPHYLIILPHVLEAGFLVRLVSAHSIYFHSQRLFKQKCQPN